MSLSPALPADASGIRDAHTIYVQLLFAHGSVFSKCLGPMATLPPGLVLLLHLSHARPRPSESLHML